MSLSLTPQLSSSKKILYLTDKLGVSEGYQPAFSAMLAQCKLRRNQVLVSSIYTLVPDCLIKKGNRKAPGFNPEKKDAIVAAFRQRVDAVQPDVIVVSCPAILGFLTDWDWGLATIDKCRGGVYYFNGTPVVVTLPISAINTHFDDRFLPSVDDDEDSRSIKAEPYRIKHGSWILDRDWEKVARIVHDRRILLPPFEYAIIRTLEDALAAKEYLTQCVFMSTDSETGCWPAQITCLGFTGLKANGTSRTFVFPFYDPTKEDGCFWSSLELQEIIWAIVRDILQCPVPKTMQNGKYDCSYFIKYRLGCAMYVVDLQYMWYSLYMELPKSLDFICSILLDNYQYWKDDIKGIEQESIGAVGYEKWLRYNGLDCYNTLYGSLRLLQILGQSPMMQTNFRDTWLRMMSGLHMSMKGLAVDKQRWNEHRETLMVEANKALARFRYMVDDPEFNINSPVDKNRLFYHILGARERNEKGRFVNHSKPYRDDNKPSTGKVALKMVRTEHPFFGVIVDALEKAMEPDKQLGNVFGRKDPVTGQIKGGIRMQTKRFRTSLNPVGTTTQRYSSKESDFWDGTNVQNIREIYQDWFVADPMTLILDVDYSQSDDVFMGYEAADAGKIKVIESGVDGHAVHGELFFGESYDSIVSGKKAKDDRIVHPVTGIRQISKRIVHGTNFQMAAFTLYASQMGRDATVVAAKLLGYSDADRWPQEKLVAICDHLMRQYRKRYPRFTKREYYADILRSLKKKGTITNAFGIERRFLGDPDDNGTQREATGFVGQSDTAGNMNRTMYEIDHGWMPQRFRDGPNPDYGAEPLKMSWRSHGFRFAMQKHDSFMCLLSLRHPDWRQAAHNLLTVMNRPIIINGRQVRVRTEASLGLRWSKDDMIEWKSKDIEDLDSIARQLHEQEGLKYYG